VGSNSLSIQISSAHHPQAVSKGAVRLLPSSGRSY
jgi:hypothetical protein